MYILYDFIFLIFMLIYLPYFLLNGKFHKAIWQRFGLLPKSINYELSAMNSPIWLHAVSVGEVAALRPLWKRLRQEYPSQGIVVSTVTKTGNELAKRFADKNEAVLYLPLDINLIVRGVLKRVRPRAVLVAETEIWPNLIDACHKKSIPVILVNGRVSNKAFRRYRLVRFALRRILEKVNFICAQTEEDRKRFIYLGAPSKNVKTAGNIKYDNIDCFAPKGTKQSLGLDGQKIVIVAGSTHRGEEKIILDVFKELLRDFQNLYLVIAPRHVERAGEVRRLIKGLPVTVVDKIGALKGLYSVSDIVFIGGSFVRHGGHNIIEPAVFARPIIFGPHMFNFQEITSEFLNSQAAIMAEDSQALEASCRRLLRDTEERARLGQNARKVVLRNQGAVENCIHEIKRILSDV